MHRLIFAFCSRYSRGQGFARNLPDLAIRPCATLLPAVSTLPCRADSRAKALQGLRLNNLTQNRRAYRAYYCTVTVLEADKETRRNLVDTREVRQLSRDHASRPHPHPLVDFLANGCPKPVGHLPVLGLADPPQSAASQRPKVRKGERRIELHQGKLMKVYKFIGTKAKPSQNGTTG